MLIAGDHDGGTRAFALGQLARRSHAYFQLFGFSPDDRAIRVRLAQGVLQAAASRTPPVARLQVRARAANLWRGARLHEGGSFHDFRTERDQQRKRLAERKAINGRPEGGARPDTQRADSPTGP